MRVVLVDPSRTALKIVGRLLEAANHEVCPFVDGPPALEHIKSDPKVEALITSAQLVTMAGIDLCQRARALASSSRPIYIVLMSSSNERSLLVDALNHGADDFIGKPPEVEELYVRLRAAERFGSMQRELARLATTDPLTGVANRRAFFAAAEPLCAAADAGEALSAVMFDIDHFKRINDAFGHSIGDCVIRAAAREAGAEGGLIGRLGGEEFAVLLGGCALAEARNRGERLRARLARLEIETAAERICFTASFGVSEWRTDDTIDELLRRADAAMYQAKVEGRNRVVAAETAPAGEAAGPRSGVLRASAR
jgi:diguanylate cyclase (GGDEF)-like protein